MEEIKDNLHISFIGVRDKVGNSFVSLNFVIEMLSRNYHVTYSNCAEDSENKHFFKEIPPAARKDSVSLHKTRFDKLELLSFSKVFDSRYSAKVEQLIKEMSGKHNIFVHNIREPLANPYNVLIQNSDIWVITMRVEATAVADYFHILQKIQMLEHHPKDIHIVFNYTKDIERAFEMYQKILKETFELSIEIRPIFLGIIQNDLLRQSHAMILEKPIREAFSECSVSGSISFIADKLLRKNRAAGSPGEHKQLLAIEETSASGECYPVEEV